MSMPTFKRLPLINNHRNESLIIPCFFLEFSRSIAKLVDEIRIFQETSYSFDVDSSLPGQLKQRIEEFSSQDIHVLAARHSSNYHQLSSDKGRKFTSTFQKMRAGLH